jgi:N-acylneuraminate cytidylyltransferase
MKTYAFIFARGGSKGVPGKNIREIGGQPLIFYSIDLALRHHQIDEVFVSTDSEQIADVAKICGARVILRPAHLATDESAEWLSWQHAVTFLESCGDFFDRFISLPATAPLRNAEDVSNCLELLCDDTDLVVSVTEAHRNPWFNQVKLNHDQSLSVVFSEGNASRRQDAPEIFDLTTIAYATRPAFIINNDGIWKGRVRGSFVPRERSLDIDTEFDLKIAQFLINDPAQGKK